MLSRRTFLIAAAGGLSACTVTPNAVVVATSPALPPPPIFVPTPDPDLTPVRNGMPAFYGPIDEEQFRIPAVKPGVVAKNYWRTRVPDPTGAPAGTIVVDPANKYLYVVEPTGMAMRYGIGVGKAGFEWAGDARILDKREWPTWTPPEEMILRDPTLRKWSRENGGQPPGLRNPLGARALYLYQGRVDTLYRIHGTPIAESIGRNMSSGCIRMLNHDVIDLYNRTPVGTPVTVRSASLPSNLEDLPDGPMTAPSVPRASVAPTASAGTTRRG